jgi:hypothetical protein
VCATLCGFEERAIAMKFTPRKGLFRLAVAALIIAMSLLLTKSFPFLVIYALFYTGWAICWLIGGFFD